LGRGLKPEFDLKGIHREMKHQPRFVSICGLPDDPIDKTRKKTVYNDLERCINVDRPAVVLDCSTLRVLDRPTLHLLLCCLEEAMKRNGDVRLAALRPEVRSVLHSTGVDFLFQCFETVSEAVESYRRTQLDFIWSDRPRAGEQSEINAA